MVAASGCTAPDPATDPRLAAVVTVGSVDSPAAALVAEIYAAALTRTGRAARVAPPVADRAALWAALDAGTLTLVPEQTGDLLGYLDPAATAVGAEDVYTAVTRALPPGLADGDYAAAAPGTPTSVVTLAGRRTVGEYPCPWPRIGLAADADPPRCADAVLARFPDADELAGALADREVAAVVPARNVFPVYREGALDDDARRALNTVAGELDTATLNALVARRQAGERSADLAAGWLDDRAG
ncbi:glycine betaine ABC transporter substrate-binding protein [Skermania piniformis]|uniref:ABC-type glycine betaine transport system substrate-binding domain-containing protein n=1 Tax=Skermania pinensis TaxID=39122 RepID=A0ABX8SDG9_9ACTN|nr:glycine betaine ABC transporter substrate-binding protein [Skermania piniformis]QXQ14660.1 hypothetical protein KV203_04440 [Skermania piniformis]